jgi:hypothetical protein
MAEGAPPLDLTLAQREQVERRIAEWVTDSSSIYAYAHRIVVKENVLPLCFDWSAFMALGSDGRVVWVPYEDEPGEVEVVRDQRIRNLGLFQGTKLHPNLGFLVPRRPVDAMECRDCCGTGVLPFPKEAEHLSKVVICYCGGLGWLPREAGQADRFSLTRAFQRLRPGDDNVSG